eukprot:TRINITY_DN21684_c0_g1_i1.p1 TRINITY_DN21684_c0_g1~~TRINITY_DN21684_c0_g1_i1.p1  ORF type:complete len:517 (+),score=147.33 TRINITY_DN21684_c0_g1_i1:63-1553(+)
MDTSSDIKPEVKEERPRESRDRERHSSRDERKSSRSHRSRSRERDGRREREGDRRGTRDDRDKRSKRSPSPVHLYLKRRKSLWDVAPSGFEMGFEPINPTTVQASNSNQSKGARRMYIGNLPEDVTENEVAEFFNSTLYSAGVSKDTNPSPVVAVQQNKEKHFAFVEFASMEDANACLKFDGIQLSANSLKVRRVKDYRPGMESVDDGTMSALPDPLISTNVEEGPNKIFIGGLPAYLTEEQVKELCASFGALKSFNLVKDSLSGNSKGFAFFEYTDPDVTDRACAGLNGMKLGEKSILVQRANVGARQVVTNPNAKSCLHNPTSLNFLNLGMPIAAAAALLQINMTDPGEPTCVVQLMNMISAEDLWNEEEYAEIMEDVREEAEKYGELASIYVPRPPKRERDEDGNLLPIYEPMWGLGRIFLEYRKTEEAIRALKALGGKKFQGRTVITGYFPEDRYIRKDFVPEAEEERIVAEKFRLTQLEKERQALEEAGEL